MGHPYAPAELQLPGFVPLQLSQGQILAPYLGTSLFVLVAIWLISGAVTLLLVQTHHFAGSSCSSAPLNPTAAHRPRPLLLAISPRIISVTASI